MGLYKRIGYAQEILVKYELQYRNPLPGENIAMPTSPTSTDIGIYEAMEDLDDLDLRLRYFYDNVPHHKDQIKSPWKLKDGSSWEDILLLPNSSQRNTQNRLVTIVEYMHEEQEPKEDSLKKRGKRRITDKFISPPTSPQILNVGYGTPFKSSSQFFVRPGGVSLPPPETVAQQNVLVGLGLPHTPAFENIAMEISHQPPRVSAQIRSRVSNPFEGRPLPPHMGEGVRERREEIAPSSSTLANRQNTDSSRNQTQHPAERRLNRGSLRNCSSLMENQRGRGYNDQPEGDLNGSSDDGDGSEHSHRNNPYNRGQLHNNPPSSPRGRGGGGGNPGGGGQGPSAGGTYPNSQPQGNIPYGNLVATIRNELKQDQLPVWDSNKDTTIEYFWKIQQLAALEGDIPITLGYWLWKSLKENSRIWMWFTTFPFSEQSKMRTHYLHYLKGIKDNYLGQTWQINMNRKYEGQSFWQEGFERESPLAFIVRRIMHT